MVGCRRGIPRSAVYLNERTLVRKHPNNLGGVQREARGPPDDAGDHVGLDTPGRCSVSMAVMSASTNGARLTDIDDRCAEPKPANRWSSSGRARVDDQDR